MDATRVAAASPLRVTREGAIVTLQFNRPEALNAVDVPMALALRDAVRDIAADGSVRAVVLCGAGKGFMAGGDLATLRADPAGAAAALLDPLNEAVALLASIDAPVIAKVHGVAAGAGMRRLMRTSFDRSLPEQLAAEAEAFVACARSEDMPRGIEAFFAKREPRFEGR